MVTDPEVVASTVGLALLIDHVESEARTATVLTMLVAQRREATDEELSRIAEWRRQGSDALLRLQHLLPASSQQLSEATAAAPAAAFQSLLRAAEERRLADQDRNTFATWEVADDYLGALLTVAERVASDLASRADATLAQARRDLASAVIGLVSLAALAVVLLLVGVAAARRRRAAERRLLEAQTELREVVRDLQLDLLADSLAQLDEIEVETRYVPAAEHARVGGDWYDAFLAGDGRVVLVIGDVLGHGGEAVVTMDRIRQTLRVLAVTHPEPRQVLAAAHRLLLHFEPSGRSAATVWLGFLDPSTGRLEFSSGGHPPPLMLAPGLPALRVESEPNPPLGSAFAWRGQGGEVVLPPGTILLLYSDGVVEAREKSIDAGIDRAAEVLEEERTASLGVIADRVMAARPDPGRDDAALLLARYTPRVVYLKVEAGEQPSRDKEEPRR